MKLEKIRVALLSVGDQQYPQDELDLAIGRVRRAVDAMPCVAEAVWAKIMNDEDATAAEQSLKDQRFDAIVVNYVSWHITPYVMRTLKHFRDVPVLVWGIGGHTDASGKLHAPAPAAKAVRSARIGLVGYADMGLYSCAYDKTLAFNKLGVDIEDYYFSEILAMMEAFSQEETEKAMARIRSEFVFTNDIPKETLEKVTRLYLAMNGKRGQRGLDAISVKCVYGVTKLGFNPCLAQSLLADKDTCVICECDAYGMLTGIMFSRATGQASAFVENYEVLEGGVLVGVCGFIPKDFVEGEQKIRSANLGEFNYGISNVSRMRTGKVTYGRLYQAGGEYRMFLAEGEALPSPKWTESGWAEPTPDFPSVLLKPGMEVKTYLENVPGQHILLVYGEHKEEIALLCRLMGIEVDTF